MAIIEVEQRETWHALHLLIDKNFTHYDSYVFRGQADNDWALESTLTRALKRIGTPANSVKTVAAAHLQAFREHIRGRCSIDLASASDDVLWSLGQHFGLATPFLDWSKSPYVALFFSLQGECKSGQRCLYALFEGDIPDVSRVLVNHSAVRIVKSLSHDNHRVVTQGGLFLDLPVGECLYELVRRTPNQEFVTLYRIDFPDSIRHDALAALNNMNINHASLFPDLVGSSLHTNYLLEAAPRLEQGRDSGFAGESK